MVSKMGLQRLTDSEHKINNLLKLKKVTFEDVDRLSKTEKDLFQKICNEKLQNAKGDERDKFYEKIEDTFSSHTRNDFWEYNHSLIMQAIEVLMAKNRRVPSRSEIAEITELSRQTVSKHLREYSTNPFYTEHFQKMRLLASNVIAKVYQNAMTGDIGSQKLYFNVMGFLNNGQGMQIQNQTNFIQINNLVLRQETIKRLNPEQLSTLENILKSMIPQPEAITMNETEKQEKIKTNN